MLKNLKNAFICPEKPMNNSFFEAIRPIICCKLFNIQLQRELTKRFRPLKFRYRIRNFAKKKPMIINPKHGIDALLFGMKQNDVVALYGKPDRQFKDDDKNVIWLYNQQKWRLTFYEDEDFRLGYIISSHHELTLLDRTIIGSELDSAKKELEIKGFKSWEKEDFDMAENHFNEANWIILQSEFGTIVKVEMGAIINDKDEFDWKFKSK